MTAVDLTKLEFSSLLEYLVQEAEKEEASVRIMKLEEKVAALEFRMKANEEIQSFFLQAMFIRFPELELCYKVLREQEIQ